MGGDGNSQLPSSSFQVLSSQHAIEIAPDRQTARAHLAAAVTIESQIGPDCPVVQMAREQGSGVLTQTQNGVFENLYVRCDGVWKFERSTFGAS